MRQLMIIAAAILVASCSAKAAAPQTGYGSQVGRFTIIHSPQVERDTFLLDTSTGQTWQLVESKEGSLTWQGTDRVP